MIRRPLLVGLALSLISISLPRLGAAQGVPVNSFRQTTFADLLQPHQKLIDDSATSPKTLINSPGALVRVRVTYTGPRRKIASAKNEMLLGWALVASGAGFDAGQRYAGLYKQDVRVLEGDKEYWVPVQEKVLKHLEKELKSGDSADLFLVFAGGKCIKGLCDWALLVEEFQKVQ